MRAAGVLDGIDWWGWSLHQIDRLRDWVTQDELNLLLGGNAAWIWDLPVPHEQMFVRGRPEFWGIHREGSVAAAAKPGEAWC